MPAIQSRDSNISTTLAACKWLLREYYGNRLQLLVLFGSAARQDLSPNSDLDLLVVLNPPIDYFSELRTIVDLLYPIQLEASHWISAKPALYSEFEAGATQLYRNIQQEGKVL
ncbi:nucleotidyltransferase domain-containing protein [Leptolyngbya sp. NK1-12]|uniref:Nucleotidyltransferase domain-containing protein n=1 Tax=Leptolyngbya sp. NK1-12 TaxID=2547451 RepID=A0AA96WF27_9CYAN|nr:nucleotidyltransferase domain-containing protein [Leptolyngbya sp. NK1-12]WNZ23859.1 nucleotidyltransferase domain-containing protein [Leptolyngbya sp. NK1-12]